MKKANTKIDFTRDKKKKNLGQEMDIRFTFSRHYSVPIIMRPQISLVKKIMKVFYYPLTTRNVKRKFKKNYINSSYTLLQYQ